MASIYIHPSIEPLLVQLQASPPHALIISGRKGTGLTTVAEYVTGEHATQRSYVQPALISKTSTIPQISVDKIREIYTDTRTRGDGQRVVIIEQADTMTESAQNAFLKLLEEPNSSTRFILTTTKLDQLLPTVRSRAQLLHVPPITKQQTMELIDELGLPDAKRPQLLFIASGLPAEITRLAGDEDYFNAAVTRMKLAKSLLAPTAYERLGVVSTLKADRHQALQLIESTIQILLARVDQATITKLALLEQAYRRIEAGGNIKLQLARAVLK